MILTSLKWEQGEPAVGPPLAAPELNYSQKRYYTTQSINWSMKHIQSLNSGIHKSEQKYIDNNQWTCLQTHHVSTKGSRSGEEEGKIDLYLFHRLQL